MSVDTDNWQINVNRLFKVFDYIKIIRISRRKMGMNFEDKCIFNVHNFKIIDVFNFKSP